MNTNEINELAKTHTQAILSSKLTKAEVIMLIACINARINETVSANPPTLAPVETKPIAKPLGAKIAEKGYPCVCVMCSKHIYTLNRDLYENTTVADFIESYTPMPGYAMLTRKTKISNIEGNITTNCPDCGAELSLYLAGKKVDG